MATEPPDFGYPGDDQGLRVVQVHPSDQRADTFIDIFAIHGLDTTSQKTWIFKTEDRNVNWLQDHDMLPHELPNARIFTCDWPSKLLRDVESKEMAIPELAKGLLLDIQRTRKEKKAKDRPLAFIASCLGGVVLAHAITIARQPDSDYRDLGNAISGIIFLATPFRGTSLAEYFQIAAWRLSAEGFFRGQVLSEELLENVGKSTGYLEDLVREFTRTWVKGDSRWPIYCFYETRHTDLLKKGLPPIFAKHFANPKILVDKSSASLDIARECIYLDAKHVTMNKFRGADDNNYKRVLDKIKQICEVNPTFSAQTRSSENAPENALRLYSQAVSSFMRNLPPTIQQHFELFNDAQPMLTSIYTIAKSNPKYENRLLVSCRKLKLFVDRLENYFQAAEVIMQVKPEVRTTILGSVALIFKLCANYINYSETLAEMFSDIANELSSYEILLAMMRSSDKKPELPYTILAMPMALVYVDILRFCQSAYHLFSSQPQKENFKRSIVDPPIWQPIDLQHRSLISRLSQRNLLLRAVIEEASTEEVLRLCTKFEDTMKIEQRRPRQPQDESTEKGLLRLRINQLLDWVDSPAWSNRFEEVRRLRTPGTCKWIFDNPTYRSWRRIMGGALGSRVLHIQAKPGYGKTFLCSSIIENLGDYVLGTKSMETHETHLVIFYFFDKRPGMPNSSSDALKAMLAQIMLLHRWNKQVIDIASVIFNEDTTSKSMAADDEIVAVLELLLDQLKFTYLVFDGLDECSDCDTLLSRVRDIASRTQTSAILFLGRPSTQLPIDMSGDCPPIVPTSQENNNDMIKFLGTQLLDVIQEKLDPEEELEPFSGPRTFGIDIGQSTNEIVQRANGMFLWVKLLLEYLRLPSLTFQDIKDAMENLNRLQGLDSIYGTILNNLEVQFGQFSLKNICRLFQLVAYSERQLQYDELHFAVSTPLEGPSTKMDTIPKFKTYIGSLSGSLLEVSKDQTVQFVHLSAQEYYIQSSLSEEQSTTSRILTNQALASRNIAAICLSYLVNTVPPEPLQGSSQSAPSRDFVRKQYPLLRYSAKYWSAHFANAFIVSSGRTESLQCGDATWPQLGHLIHDFLIQKGKVMVWIEASWLENAPANIHKVPAAESIRTILKDTQIDSSKLLHAAEDLEELSRDLKALTVSWSYILNREPYEIWGPSIPCFTPSRFWLGTGDARVVRAPLFQSDSAKFITIRSKISRDGTECGVVKLLPPESWLNCSWRAEDPTSRGWKARYEIWSLDSNEITQNIEISLTDEAMEPFVDADLKERLSKQYGDAGNSSVEEEYEFPPSVSLPVEISDDLRRIIVLDHSVIIRSNSATEGEEYIAPNTETLYYQVLDLNTEASFVEIRPDLSQADQWPAEDFYHVKFSPSAEFFVLIRESVVKSNKGSQWYGLVWLMQIFRDETYGSRLGESPKYVCIITTRFFSVPEVSILSPVRGVVFHPSLPRLAFPQTSDGLPQTYIWDLDRPVNLDEEVETDRNPFPVSDPHILDPIFSDDGKYLYGTDTPIEFGSGVISRSSLKSLGKAIITKIPGHIAPDPKPSVADSQSSIKAQTSPDQTLAPFHRAALELALRPNPAVQRANSLVFDQDKRGVVYISQIQQIEKEGKVVLNSFGTNGKFTSQSLSRLPKEVTHCLDVSIVHREPGSVSDIFRIVLDKAPQRVYTLSDVNSNVLPAILVRKKASISKDIKTIPMGLANDGIFPREVASSSRQELRTDRP